MGYAAAATRMGDLYNSGDAWDKDQAQAIHYYQMASNLGSSRAREKLAEISQPKQ